MKYNERHKWKRWLIFLFMSLMVFQNPLEDKISYFSYVDELIAAGGVLLGIYNVFVIERCIITEKQLRIGIPLCIFVCVGLLGNFMYQYQPIKCVIVDLYTNLKFFFAITGGYFLFQYVKDENIEKDILWSAKCLVIFLFIVFLADRVCNFYPAEIRHGIKSVTLFYEHPTYLAAVMAFFLVVFTVFFNRKNSIYIVLTLIMMMFTLRSKAIAGAVLYIILLMLFIVWKVKVKLWHVLMLGILCVFFAWPQLSYYFIELGGTSARSVMLLTSFLIMKNNFPIGTGFGTYGSAEAAKNYSPVYMKYGFNGNFELRNIKDVDNSIRLINKHEWMTQKLIEEPEFLYANSFLSDQFWPIIFGQTGFIGTLAFLIVMFWLVRYCMEIKKINIYAYVGGLYAISYLIIASVAETAFHSAVAIPLALMIGIVLQKKKISNLLTV